MRPHEILKNYVSVLLNTNTHSLVIKGCAGLGKTYTVLETLKAQGLKEDLHYIYITGFITPLELYNTLARCATLQEPKIFIFDDLEGIISNKTCVGLLKSALGEARGKRIVSYRSTSSKVEDVKSIDFDGKMIMIINNLKEENAFGKSLLDRGIFYNMVMGTRELTTYIESVLEKMSSKLENEEKHKVWEDVKRFAGHRNFSLRSLNRAFQFYEHSHESWYDLFLNTLNLTAEQLMVYELSKEEMPENEKAEKYAEITGKSTRSYYREKKVCYDGHKQQN